MSDDEKPKPVFIPTVFHARRALDASGFRVGRSYDYRWGDGKRDECAALMGEPIAALIYDGPKPEGGPYVVRVSSVTKPKRPKR